MVGNLDLRDLPTRNGNYPTILVGRYDHLYSSKCFVLICHLISLIKSNKQQADIWSMRLSAVSSLLDILLKVGSRYPAIVYK